VSFLRSDDTYFVLSQERLLTMAYDNVLLATDGSDPAKAATKEAIRIVRSFDATLHALYVLNAGEPSPEFEDPAIRPGVDTKAETALDAVKSEATDQGYGRDIVWSVVRGSTAQSILTYAQEHEIDLIIMGTHGRTGLDRLIIGSVAEHVIRESPVPVVTARDDHVSNKDGNQNGS
jgi:nucleotide-binding universal stress UspA family protein